MKLEYKWHCPICNKNFESRRKLQKHRADEHNGEKIAPKIIICNCQYCNKKFTHGFAKNSHEKYCKLNPSRVEYKGHLNSKETRQKISNSAKRNKKSGGYRQGAGYKSIKKGFYKGIWCDSSWELAFLIYCLEHNITIKRNTDKFPYYIENKLHYYIPDFIIGNTYIEIKGRVDYKCKYKFEQFPNKQRLKIYYAKDMKCFLNYVYKKYGYNFIDLYDNRIYVKKEKIIKNHNWYCKYCNIKFNTRRLLFEHLKICEKRIEYKSLKNKKSNDNLKPIQKDKTGRYNYNILPENIWNERKEKILSCGIDLMKFGWVSKVKQLTGLTQRELENTLEHFNAEFEGKYFKRKYNK